VLARIWDIVLQLAISLFASNRRALRVHERLLPTGVDHLADTQNAGELNPAAIASEHALAVPPNRTGSPG